MIEALLNPYIDNIPWDRIDKALIEENASRYAKNIEYVMDRQPESISKIDFNDDVWDFSQFRPDACERITINFRKANICYKDFLKMFAILKMVERTRIRSVCGHVGNIKKVVNSVLESKRIRSISILTTQDLIEAIERFPVKENTKYAMLSSCAQFFAVIECEIRVPVLVDSEELYEAAAIKSHNNPYQKTQTIPDEYFGIIKDTCMKVLMDESASYKERMTAGEILIEGQTGLRTEDLLNLKLGDVKAVEHYGKVFHYLDFETRKPSRSDQYFKRARCRLNETCLTAIRKMEELGAEHRLKAPFDFIYTLEASPRPVRKQIFECVYRRLLYTYAREACLKPWPGINATGLGKNTRVHVPSMRQYRVFVCTDLYRQGVSLVNIMRSMGHISSTMAGYYVRQKETWQNDRAKAARQIIKAVVDEKTVPLGNPTASRMNGVIGKIVDDTKVNIAGSNEEILETLGKKLIVRAKPGGYCIRTGRTCAEDYRTDQTLCAYDECPNIYYFYFNLSTAYEDMRNAETTYQQALDAGHKREAEKEQYKIVNIARRRIIPMLDELERMLATSTVEEIEERHPGMAETIRKKDDIRKEAMDWIAKSE